MNNDMMQLFFTNLSKRMDSENNLSDVTWAICETNAEFKRLFIEFFFGSNVGKANDIVLEREYHDKRSRPDFRFFHDEKEYIIEVKIYDGNDHFEQYKADFPNAEIGWIANYEKKPPKDEKIRVKSWNSFHEMLLYYLKNTSNQEDFAILNGYCTYLKSVCLIIKIQKMSFEKMSSLLNFNSVIKKLVKLNYNGLNIEPDGGANAISKSRYGTFFSLIREDSKKVPTIYGWFGVGWDDSNTWIGVFFSKYYCPEIYKGFKDGSKLVAGNYHMKPELNSPEASHIMFKMEREYFNKFHQIDSHLEQEKILSDFFHEVIDLVKVHV